MPKMPGPSGDRIQPLAKAYDRPDAFHEQLGLKGHSMTMARVWGFLTGWEVEVFRKPVDHWKGSLAWPPDVFAMCCAILKRSGAYASLREISPRGGGRPANEPDLKKMAMGWQEWLERAPWRKDLPDSNVPEIAPTCDEISKCLPEIELIWEKIWECRYVPVSQVVGSASLLGDLVKMVALSDEVSQGCGLPLRGHPGEKGRYRLILEGWSRLEPTEYGSSLCTDLIHPTAARVLPKMHVPRAGLTLRSLSHHLAFCEADEVQPRWFMIPGARGDVANKDAINLLLLPWPYKITPSQIRRSEVGADSSQQAGKGPLYFTCKLDNSGSAVADLVDDLCEKAKNVLGSLDGVILPELALTVDDYRMVRERVLARSLLLVAGVGCDATAERPGESYVCADVPLSRHHAVHFRQAKHHRWRLDGTQIKTYGLGALDPAETFWEDIEIGERKLLFLVLRPWLVTSVLICEDLARHDPVGELLRGVGPHLVIALLMDGPQLPQRWPGRYATVLADDPGSSIITISSLGMVGLSRPNPTGAPSRVVALWKDADGQTTDLAVPEGSDALALTLSVKYATEVTADARDDAGTAAYPVLTGVHPITRDPELRRRAVTPRRGSEKEDDNVRFLSPHEAAALARLVQQDVNKGAPALFGEFTGEARYIAREVWRRKTQKPTDAEMDKLREKPEDYADLPADRHRDTAKEIERWWETNREKPRPAREP
jgi:hypothetical protein